MADQRFLRKHRLRRPAQFERVYRGNAFVADGVLVVGACPSEHPHARMGLAVSRKAGGAVIRNRWKRLLREAFRLSREELPSGVDLVVRPRRGATPDFHAIRRSLPRLARRAARRLAKERS